MSLLSEVSGYRARFSMVSRLLATRDDVEQWVASEVVKGVPGHIPMDNTNNWALLCLLR